MDINELQAAVARELQLYEYSEDWKRSIPAQIFLNYFFSCSKSRKEFECLIEVINC